MTASEAAYELGVSDLKISRLCQAGRVPGAVRTKAAWAIPADALSALREMLAQPFKHQPKPAPAPAKSEPAPVGMMTPPEAAAALGVTPGYVCNMAARGLAPGARKGDHPSHRHLTWLFPPEAIAFMRRYLDAAPAERTKMRTQSEDEMPVLQFIHSPGDHDLAEQVWAWHLKGRP